MIEPGTQIGRYEIQRRLGRGGMGTVYVAHDPVLGRMVAIKVFAGDLDIPDARDRFTREARSAAALNHPSIVTVYDFGEYASQPYIVMEYVPGETLAAVIRRKAPATIADKLRWMEELCAGAGYAHQMSVIHRDIKPANLMLTRGGSLKILDFGIARMMGTASSTMAMIGTAGYMSPEQIQGDGVDNRSDLFAIGVVLYELLSYTEAFPGDTMPTIVHRVLTDAPASLTRLVPEVPADVVGIVDRLLQKRAEDRFQDAESVRAALARARLAAGSDPGFNAPPTTVVRRDSPPAAFGSRGTGSARQGSGDAVGVGTLTPPPDPRRTDREAVARRRAEQLQGALADARARLAVGDLDGALDACQLALTFDETHPDALALEEAIAAECLARDGRSGARAQAVAGAAPIAEPTYDRTMVARAAPAAQTPPVPSQPPTPAGMADAPPAPDLDAAIAEAQRNATVLTPRRTPPPSAQRVPSTAAPVAPVTPAFDPAPAPAPSVARAPAAKSPAPKGAPASRPGGAARAAKKSAGNAAILALTRAVTSLRTTIAAQPRQRLLYAGAAAAGVVVLGVAAVVVTMLFSGPPPTGTLVIDAVPWGSVQSIESDAGERQALPSQTATPLAMQLPVGTYQVVVAGPPPQLETQRLTVQVTQAGTTIVPMVRFAPMTAEAYFEQYLSLSAAPDAAAAGPAAEGAAPADTSSVPPGAPPAGAAVTPPTASPSPGPPASPTGVTP